MVHAIPPPALSGSGSRVESCGSPLSLAKQAPRAHMLSRSNISITWGIEMLRRESISPHFEICQYCNPLCILFDAIIACMYNF